ncbi:DUF2975 domain-containing protein [Novosphingobium sp. AP12]|uniref:DUF2975 domain-containing protein n=1 Tax=Novosphingobium sp. AP12 TaxID=1144305 RepID=UPI000272059C|nr:DUF2975 domain-containing protein [Novosphingobium sp. AP12]EJL25934.1 hypothetical protein PMI02_03141 [Novosphingobium sp. AP12]
MSGPIRSFTRDPLLAVAHGFVLVAMAVTAFVGAVLLVMAPVMVLGRANIMSHIESEDLGGMTANTFVGIGGIMLLLAVMALLAFLFLRHLLRLIGSVDKGDPFNPVNATRLAAMGWLTLAIETISFPVGLIAAWIAQTVKGADSDIDVGFSLTGVLLAIILFILARVFRKGAEMRAELEGTV